MSGLFESVQRSQQNIDELAGGLRNYLTQKRDNDYKQFMYGKIRELTQPQTTFSGGDTRPTENVAPVQGQPTQNPSQMRGAMSEGKQMPAGIDQLGAQKFDAKGHPIGEPVSPSSQIQPTDASQTGQANTRTLSKPEALRVFLSNNPPRTQEELNAVKQYVDMLNITEPKVKTQFVAPGSYGITTDESGNPVGEPRQFGQPRMQRVEAQGADGKWYWHNVDSSGNLQNTGEISPRQLTAEAEANKETSAQRQAREMAEIAARGEQGRQTKKVIGGGNSAVRANAKQAWESEKSAILKATKGAITEEDWDKPYSEVRSKLRGLGSTPTERENRWYKAHQLKSKAEVSGQIEQPKPGTPAPQVAVDPNDPMGILK